VVVQYGGIAETTGGSRHTPHFDIMTSTNAFLDQPLIASGNHISSTKIPFSFVILLALLVVMR
jgi:hypothetical protein